METKLKNREGYKKTVTFWNQGQMEIKQKVLGV